MKKETEKGDGHGPLPYGDKLLRHFGVSRSITIVARWRARKEAYEEIIWCLIAYPRSSALVLILSASIIRYLWKATVPGFTSITLATCFIERPSASSCRISLCLFVIRFSSVKGSLLLRRNVTVSFAMSGER